MSGAASRLIAPNDEISIELPEALAKKLSGLDEI
jgi:hypothetical protein